MEKLVVIADKLKWGREMLRKGAEFEASPKHAKLLKDIGRAEAAGVKGPTDLPAEVMKRAVKAEEPAAEAAPVPEPESGVYKRRDMVAETLVTTPYPKAPGRRGRPKKSRS